MLKLGSETGSLVNHMYSRTRLPELTVGMGATICHWTDRSAGTVISIENLPGRKRLVCVQDDNSKRVDSNGMSEMQDYEYTPNPNGAKSYYRIDADDRIVGVSKNPDTGRWNKTGSGNVIFGRREEYYDFSF